MRQFDRIRQGTPCISGVDGEDIALHGDFGPTRGRRVWRTAPPVVPKQTLWNFGTLAREPCSRVLEVPCLESRPRLRRCARQSDVGWSGRGWDRAFTRAARFKTIIQNVGVISTIYIYTCIYIYIYIYIYCNSKARGNPIHRGIVNADMGARKRANISIHIYMCISLQGAPPPPGGILQGRWSAAGQAPRCAQLGRTCARRPVLCA